MSRRNGHHFSVIKDQPTTPEDISAAEQALREEDNKRQQLFLAEVQQAQGRAAQAVLLGPEVFNAMLMYGQLPVPAARWLRSFLQALGDAGQAAPSVAYALPEALCGDGGENLMLVPIRRFRNTIYSCDILPWVVLLSELIPQTGFDFHAVCARFVQGYREVSGEGTASATIEGPYGPECMGTVEMLTPEEAESLLNLADEETAQAMRGSGLLGALLKGEE